MAHEITAQDSLALAGTKAWHGIGNVLPEAMDMDTALAASGLDWEVQVFKNLVQMGDQLLPTTSGATVYRMPRAGVVDANGQPEQAIELSTVGNRWAPVQNRVLFETAATALGQGVRAESAGSIRQGRRVFLLLRGETIRPVAGDEVHQYLLLANGHDDVFSFRAIPTSVRVVCSNTLHMALGNKAARAYTIQHSGNPEARAKEMAKALADFKATGDLFASHTARLAQVALNEEGLKQFWGNIFADLHKERKGVSEQEVRDTMLDWEERMEIERLTTGAPDITLWEAANAVTGWLQHREPAPQHMKEGWMDSRMESGLFGDVAARTTRVFNAALTAAL